MKSVIDNINFIDYLKIHSPGYVIEIYQDGKKEEFVIGNKATKPNVISTTADTLYDIASLTKMFTCVLVYMAYEENIIDLNNKIYDIDNNYKNLKDISVLDLLSHNQNIWTDGYLGSAKNKEEFYQILYSAYVKEKNPTYVDTHYIILTTLLEKIYQKSYKDLCQEKIFDRLGMSNTTFNPDENRCASNNFEYTKEKVVDNIYPGLIHDTKARIAKEFGLYLGHASIFATGKDMLTFLETFLNNKLLKKGTIEFMLSHRNTNEENYKTLVSLTNKKDINEAYKEYKKLNSQIILPRTYNNMGTRYKNIIEAVNDVPIKAGDNSISFSGYTGPMFTIDFDNQIIVLVMCNIIHNSKLDKVERKAKTFELINSIFDQLL